MVKRDKALCFVWINAYIFKLHGLCFKDILIVRMFEKTGVPGRCFEKNIGTASIAQLPALRIARPIVSFDTLVFIGVG